ncbi:uncharacterized protein N7459_005973 [Penicillium hispanicum]|uniref:uncharacterized protein n=1 Tax=Penicillium hispanicum TaxID=1080232 RepID=UPI0025412156|nr:uncharacterized protein N7459_005973 [Penicillium hispanicum]KAJ5579988.1 hypothetical protein N7459_005973 [Penicillium hispanicum]
MMDWIIKELQWKAGIYRKTGMLRVFDIGVVKSDTVISNQVQQALKDAVIPLESLPEDQKDFHPGSDQKVVDLVHPSLFPVIYGRTRVLPDRVIGVDDCIDSMGQGQLIPIPSDADATPDIFESYGSHRLAVSPLSQRFQWLPCDIELTEHSKCRIVSYINNAHPVKHRALYGVVEDVIAKALPLWNQSLTEKPFRSDRIKFVEVEYGESSEPEPIYPEDAGDDFDEEACFERFEAWEASRPIRICATAIYYYDSENITESALGFRQRGMSDMNDINYEQDRHEFLQEVYGLREDVDGRNAAHITQELGNVLCKEGRLITFPNTLQHRVLPFSLADRSKPGHRKILALFLVVPHRRIVSSANVPPQREDWTPEDPERQDGVTEDIPSSLMTMAEAKEHRVAIMEERGLRHNRQNESFEVSSFSLCEH